MKHVPMRPWWMGFYLSASLCLAACGGGGDDGTAPVPVPPAALGKVTGVALASDDSSPLAKATVRAAGVSAVTAADGSFQLDKVPAAERQVLTVEADGFVDAKVAVQVSADQTSRASARLVRASAVTVIDAASAATVTAAGSNASVDLPANGLVNGAGVAASGKVNARITPIDPAADPQSMPGDYTTPANARIESFGAVEVSLKDDSGAKLNLKPGSTATIRIPLASRSSNPPASIPLFYLDEATGRWVQEGSATLKGMPTSRYYEGTVAHFSYWNADQLQDTIYVHGCVVDKNNKPLGLIEANSVGIDYSGSASTITDALGKFTVPIRKSSRAQVYAETDDAVSNKVVVGPSETDITLSSCLVIDSAAAAPTLVASPQNQTAVEGDRVCFSVVANGSRTLTYQWRRNGAVISGADNDTYCLAAADNGSTYSVDVTNAYGTVTSAPATLTVTQPVLTAPVLQLQPLDAKVNEGSSAIFRVLATGTPAPTYQWKRNGVDIAGATQDIYATLPLALADSGAVYSVVVSNSQGSVTSNAATLTVSPGTTADVAALARLLTLSFEFYPAASFPLLTTSNGSSFVDPATVCSAGTLAVSLNGSPVKAGAVVPSSGTLAGTANGCINDSMSYTGSSTVTYQLTGTEPQNGSASATVSNVRQRAFFPDGTVRSDITANGQGSVTFAGSVNGADTTTTVTLTLASGATLTNGLSGLTATFGGGSVAVQTTAETGTSQVKQMRLTYNEMRFSVSGVSYLANGYYELNTGSPGVISGSGEVILSSNGTRVGRIFVTADGQVQIEANGAVQPFGGIPQPNAR